MLELKNLSYSVEGKEILNNVNLTIDDGKFIVITGPNGGGKSTLAKIIAGILTPKRPDFVRRRRYNVFKHYGKSKNGHQFCLPAASPF